LDPTGGGGALSPVATVPENPRDDYPFPPRIALLPIFNDNIWHK
jgi:hypothetical protein